MRGGPAGADAHHGMRVVGLLGKAELDLALQTVDSRLIHRHENLVGGRFESERVALGAQGLANTIGRLIGVAGDLNWQDLLRVDAGSWYSKAFKGEPLPLLSQVAERCREHGMMANIEIKPTTGTGPLTGKMVALAARELWAGMTPPLLSSFEIDALEAAQQAVPELPRGLLLDEWRDDWRELTARLGCVSIHLNHKLLDKARVMQLKDAGLRILVYTVNKPQRAAELLRWGVDCICTDAIDVIGPNFTAQ